jgi:hypothetical protein
MDCEWCSRCLIGGKKERASLVTTFHTRTKQLAELWFYFMIYIPGQQAGRQKSLNRMVASISRNLVCS